MLVGLRVFFMQLIINAASISDNDDECDCGYSQIKRGIAYLLTYFVRISAIG